MGIEKRKGKHGARYRFRVYRHEKTQKGPWRQMIEEAEEDERNYRRIINLPVHSLEGCVKDYLLDSVEKRSKNRYDGIRYNMGRWIIPFFGSMTNVNTITSEHVDQFIDLHRKRGVKNITIWHYVKDLNALFTWAIRKHRMVENPVIHVRTAL